MKAYHQTSRLRRIWSQAHSPESR